MRLIDADALKGVMIETLERIKANPKMDTQEMHIIAAFHAVGEMVDDAPTVDAVPFTDVEELNMRISGADAAVNGMREQINRMVIINSEKVSVVRCEDCLRYYKGRNGWTCGLTGCTHNGKWYCADGERRKE